jgi:hypothetical protein
MSHVTKPTRPLVAECPPLVIPPRFCGPPGSGNGGYVCGRVAAYLDGPVTVTLRQPPPLAAPMAVERHGEGSVRVHHGQTLIAESTSSPGGPALEIPRPVSLAEARAVAGGSRYYADPVFPGCFVCGTGRALGDGLRIFPGPLTGGPLAGGPLTDGPLTGGPVCAAPWTPDPSVADADGRVRPEMVWAALDCPSGIAAAEATDLTGETFIVLGRMTACVAALPAVGDQCLLIAWPGARDGRKLLAGSALVGPGGRVLAAARAVWLTVPRPAPAPAAQPLAAEPLAVKGAS